MTSSLMLNSVPGSGFSSSVGLLAGNMKAQETERKFGSLVDGIKAGLDNNENKKSSFSSSEIKNDPRLPGDFISSFTIEHPTQDDHAAKASGAAANIGMKGSVDKTSKLYEQALELESYFVKIMLSSMRSTVTKSSLTGENNFASKMYEDMQYDELSRTVTQNAGFGLADQVYLQLEGNS